MEYLPHHTKDGSFTFFSEQFQEAFHSHYGARQEAIAKFVEPSEITYKAKQKDRLRLLDICYGLGYNSAAALEAVWQTNPQCCVELIGLELEPAVPQQASERGLLEQWQQPIPQLLTQLATARQVNTKKLNARLIIGDARQTIVQLKRQQFLADALFLDPFSPPKCPQLWTVEFLQLATQCLHPQGKIVTYSCAAAVRAALQLSGLWIGSTPSVGRNSPGTVANLAGNLPLLSQQEREHLDTRAAIPYRDPTLQDSAQLIHQRRQQEQTVSHLEPSSHWKKRWFFSTKK